MKKAFTLIELLVVVAIIALLVALLLPALKNARGMARQTQCLANLRQLMMLVNLYADDNGDYIPSMVMEQNLPPTFPACPAPADYPANWYPTWCAQVWPYQKSRAIWICPGSGNTETGVNYYPQFGHYGGNAPTVFNWPRSFNPAAQPLPIKRGAHIAPSNRYAIFDSGAYWCSEREALQLPPVNAWGSYIPGASWNSANNFGGNAGDIFKRRHPYGVCVVFVDGHTEALEVVKFCNNTSAW